MEQEIKLSSAQKATLRSMERMLTGIDKQVVKIENKISPLQAQVEELYQQKDKIIAAMNSIAGGNWEVILHPEVTIPEGPTDFTPDQEEVEMIPVPKVEPEYPQGESEEMPFDV